MAQATLRARNERRVVVSELAVKIEDVLRTGSREGARALVPDLRLLCEKLRRVRQRGGDFGAVGLSKYVVAVAALAGKAEEFAEFA